MKPSAYTKSALGRAHRGRRGQSLVEFALVAPLFFLLVFGITDLGRLFFTKTTLQHALREAGRYAVTGQKRDQDPTREASILNKAQQYAVGLLNPTDFKIKSISGGVVTDNSAGGPGATVIVTLSTDFNLITPMMKYYFRNTGGKYKLTVSTSFKNELFDPS